MNRNDFYLWCIGFIMIALLGSALIRSLTDANIAETKLRQQKIETCASIENGLERTLCLKDV